MNKWIIDTDAGVDDAQALILALSSDIEVIAITTVSGNTPESNVYRNVCEILRVCKKDINIYRGAIRPIINTANSCPEFHGDDGLNNYWLTHSPSNFPVENQEAAASAIARLSKEHPGVNIICLGPLTNLATAYLLEKNLSFGRIEIMGGTSDAIGNITALAEFNIHQDPEAAFIVFDRSPNIVITPWETTSREELRLNQNLYKKMMVDTEKGRLLKEISKCDRVMCDVVAMAVAIDPSIIISYENRHVAIELAGNYSRGHTVVCRDVDSIQNPNLKRFQIVKSIDYERYYKMLIDSAQID